MNKTNISVRKKGKAVFLVTWNNEKKKKGGIGRGDEGENYEYLKCS